MNDLDLNKILSVINIRDLQKIIDKSVSKNIMIESRFGYNAIDGFCPRCDSYLTWEEIENDMACYCKYCGQKLLWSDY